ncbi:hypothetical protein [Chryseobacterium sp.]|uniref:hypothetical protein n=1 Tax=Chryseobacterium sp. TaxID=1871047 RepID=UPI0011CA3C9B|nr:hypothetical protein [Chryseobacterium sp.]TXF75178.1 hypothetical protein FUA25_13005 [Chryseobacterium sp.]
MKGLYFQKGILFFSFFLSVFVNGQVFIRDSDQKVLDSIPMLHQGKQVVLKKSNFNDYHSAEADKVIFGDKLVDFYIHQDTLIFFDKVKEIESVELFRINTKSRKEKNIKSRKNGAALSEFFLRQQVATFVKINSTKKTFIKSITVFPEILGNPKGILQIQIVPNINGVPDLNAPILTFDKNLDEVSLKKWEIRLPRIIKYPQNGFFLVFYLKSGEKQNITLRLNKDSEMLFYYPQSQEWKSLNFNGYQFQIKVLQ